MSVLYCLAQDAVVEICEIVDLNVSQRGKKVNHFENTENIHIFSNFVVSFTLYLNISIKAEVPVPMASQGERPWHNQE